MDRIAILDFGGQTTQLIGRRLRDGGYYAEIFPGDSSPDLWRKEDTKGVIFSGSPYSSYEKGSPAIHPESYTQGLPVLGICYGFPKDDLGPPGQGGTISYQRVWKNSLELH
jgi:GMP synthase (glutamine-hydrolysing)